MYRGSYLTDKEFEKTVKTINADEKQLKTDVSNLEARGLAAEL